MRAYPVNLRKDGKFILVTFPDIPEAITQGNDRPHALEMAKEVLRNMPRNFSCGSVIFLSSLRGWTGGNSSALRP